MKNSIIAAVAPMAVAVTRSLRRWPALMEQALKLNKNYIDWRAPSMSCRTSYGASFACNLNDIIQHKIAYFGIWEPNLTNYMQRTLRRGDVLIDIGSNIGYFTLLGSTVVGETGAVVAIDASPRVFSRLEENIAANGAKNIRAVNLAVSDKKGTLPVYAGPPNNSGMSSTAPREGTTYYTTIEARPLHEILTPDEMARARLIKIDVEGAEGPVVRSIIEHLDAYNPHCELAIEILPETSHVITDLMDAGFFPYLLENIYFDSAYLYPSNRRPERFRGTLTQMSDFIFSRRDAETL